MHIVGHCNFDCHYCYARFVTAKEFLPLEAARRILPELRERGVRRITFAGGEPMLHRDLEAMLRTCAELGLITSVVTNASRLDRPMCERMFPWIRWLVVSCDSHLAETNASLGRGPKKSLDVVGQPARTARVAEWVHEWNRDLAREQHVRLKLNLVVTSLNVHEDPSAWLAALRPERVKLLQCSIIPGENDDAEHLRCAPEAFTAYARRLVGLPGITVVAETSEDLLESYAMVDPAGRFRQALPTGYVLSSPIQEVGVEVAWEEVGGCNLEKFKSRGGEYDDGAPCQGKPVRVR